MDSKEDELFTRKATEERRIHAAADLWFRLGGTKKELEDCVEKVFSAIDDMRIAFQAEYEVVTQDNKLFVVPSVHASGPKPYITFAEAIERLNERLEQIKRGSLTPRDLYKMERLTFSIGETLGEAFNLDMVGNEVKLITYTYTTLLPYFAVDYIERNVKWQDHVDYKDLVAKCALEHLNTPSGDWDRYPRFREVPSKLLTGNKTSGNKDIGLCSAKAAMKKRVGALAELWFGHAGTEEELENSLERILSIVGDMENCLRAEKCSGLHEKTCVVEPSPCITKMEAYEHLQERLAQIRRGELVMKELYKMKRLTYTVPGYFHDAFNLDMVGDELKLVTFTCGRILYYFAADYRDVKVGQPDWDLVAKWALEHSDAARHGDWKFYPRTNAMFGSS